MPIVDDLRWPSNTTQSLPCHTFIQFKPIQCQQAPLQVHSTSHSQQTPERSSLSCVSSYTATCQKKSHCQWYSSARRSAVTHGVFSNTLVVLQEYLVQICLPIDISHMSKQWNMLWLDSKGKWRLCITPMTSRMTHNRYETTGNRI